MILLIGSIYDVYNKMCTGEDLKAMDALYHSPQWLTCVYEKCLGVPYLPCLGKCFHQIMDKKLTPTCLHCHDQVVSCGTTKCDVCLVPGDITSAVLCSFCMYERCTKEILACDAMQAPMLIF